MFATMLTITYLTYSSNPLQYKEYYLKTSKTVATYITLSHQAGDLRHFPDYCGLLEEAPSLQAYIKRQYQISP